MSTNPYESPETGGNLLPRKSIGPTLLKLLAVVAALGVLGALLLPSLRRVSPEAARQFRCRNNLRQIAVALQNYHDVYQCLPPAFTVDAAGKPLHSWRTLILPFMQEKALYDQIDLSKPWDDPANRAALEVGPPAYHCPSSRVANNQSTYLAIVAPGGCFKSTESRMLAEITDDAGLTIIVIEVPAEHAVPWMSPKDASEALVLSLISTNKPPHSAGAQAACAGGNVLFIDRKVSSETLRALISIAGNDDRDAEAVY